MTTTHNEELQQGRNSSKGRVAKGKLVNSEVREAVRNEMLGIVNSYHFWNELYRDIERREPHVSKKMHESYVAWFVGHTRNWLLYHWDAIDDIEIEHLASNMSRCRAWLDEMWKEEWEED